MVVIPCHWHCFVVTISCMHATHASSWWSCASNLSSEQCWVSTILGGGWTRVIFTIPSYVHLVYHLILGFSSTPRDGRGCSSHLLATTWKDLNIAATWEDGSEWISVPRREGVKATKQPSCNSITTVEKRSGRVLIRYYWQNHAIIIFILVEKHQVVLVFISDLSSFNCNYYQLIDGVVVSHPYDVLLASIGSDFGTCCCACRGGDRIGM